MKNDAVKLTALAAAILAGSLSIAEARDGGPRERVDFETLDTDGNGEVTQTEMQARANARFADADADGNGSLSRSELLARAERANETRVDRMIKRLDANEDGALSEEELRAGRRGQGANRFFARADTDNSGGISKEEFDAVAAKAKDRRAKRNQD